MYDVTRSLGELQPESFTFVGEFGESSIPGLGESPFSEAEEMELAAELLAVGNEAELEQFLGNFFKKAWSGIKTVGSKLAPLGGVLKTVAKVALPTLATAAGTFFGGPVGGAIGGKLGSLVSQALEAEAAAMTPGDRDFEKCRQFVRMAGIAAKAAAAAPPGADPVAVARKSLAETARQTIANPGRTAAVSTTATTAGPSLRPVLPSPQQQGPRPRPSTTAQSRPRAPGIAGRPEPQSVASLGFVPPAASRGGGAAIAQPQAAAAKPGAALHPVGASACACGKSPTCTCAKCRAERGAIGGSGRWVRRGRSIVIINC